MTRLRAVAYRRRYVLIEIGFTALVILGIYLILGNKRTFAAVPLIDMLRTFVNDWGSSHFKTDVLPSLGRLAVGYTLSVVASLVIGFILGLSRPIRYACQPVVAFLRAIPPVALLPLALVLLGVGNSMKIGIIAFVCLWPVVLNVVDGLGELDATLLATVRTYRISGYDRLFRVLLPAVSPRALAGMRTSLSLAVLLLVSSEIEASSNGIGFFLFQAQQSFAIADMWAAIILLGLLGYVLNVIFTIVERRVLRWQVVSSTEI